MAQAPHQHIQRVSRSLLAVARGESTREESQKRAGQSAHARLREHLLSLLWVTIAVDVIATLVVFFTERHASGTQIHNLWDAFLFSTSQLITASSVASPTSETGKVLELFFDVYAITVVASLAGSFGAFFHRRHEEDEAVAAATTEAGD